MRIFQRLCLRPPPDSGPASLRQCRTYSRLSKTFINYPHITRYPRLLSSARQYIVKIAISLRKLLGIRRLTQDLRMPFMAQSPSLNVHNDLNPVIWAGASSNRNSTSVWGNTLQIPDAGQTPLTPSSSTSSPSMSSNSHLHPASTDAQHAITCDQCGKGPFGRQYELKRHQTYVHHPPRWTCGICGNCFKRKDDCQRHLRRQHETE
ncbi:hypothetical protein BC835DRAFT_606566 [Cytidiella melzeri]|nr:hypothetical protein BC835DRAFT_606566 [Cytidiella melzeri]